MKAEPRFPCQVNAAYSAAPLLPHTHTNVSFSFSTLALGTCMCACVCMRHGAMMPARVRGAIMRVRMFLCV